MFCPCMVKVYMNKGANSQCVACMFFCCMHAQSCSCLSLVPRPIPSYSMLHGGPGIRSHVTDLIHMKGGRRVKMNVSKPKVSEVQATAVHNMPEVRLQNY